MNVATFLANAPWRYRMSRILALAAALTLLAGCQEDCCKRCTKGKPCGDTCIEKTETCKKGAGCACED